MAEVGHNAPQIVHLDVAAACMHATCTSGTLAHSDGSLFTTQLCKWVRRSYGIASVQEMELTVAIEVAEGKKQLIVDFVSLLLFLLVLLS